MPAAFRPTIGAVLAQKLALLERRLQDSSRADGA